MAIVESLEALRASAATQRDLLAAITAYFVAHPLDNTLDRRLTAIWVREHIKSPKLITARDALLEMIEDI